MHNDVSLTNCVTHDCYNFKRDLFFSFQKINGSSTNMIGKKENKSSCEKKNFFLEMKTQFPTFEIEIVEVSLLFI